MASLSISTLPNNQDSIPLLHGSLGFLGFGGTILFTTWLPHQAGRLRSLGFRKAERDVALLGPLGAASRRNSDEEANWQNAVLLEPPFSAGNTLQRHPD